LDAPNPKEQLSKNVVSWNLSACLYYTAPLTFRYIQATSNGRAASRCAGPTSTRSEAFSSPSFVEPSHSVAHVACSRSRAAFSSAEVRCRSASTYRNGEQRSRFDIGSGTTGEHGLSSTECKVRSRTSAARGGPLTSKCLSPFSARDHVSRCYLRTVVVSTTNN